MLSLSIWSSFSALWLSKHVNMELVPLAILQFSCTFLFSLHPWCAGRHNKYLQSLLPVEFLPRNTSISHFLDTIIITNRVSQIMYPELSEFVNFLLFLYLPTQMKKMLKKSLTDIKSITSIYWNLGTLSLSKSFLPLLWIIHNFISFLFVSQLDYFFLIFINFQAKEKNFLCFKKSLNLNCFDYWIY